MVHFNRNLHVNGQMNMHGQIDTAGIDSNPRQQETEMRIAKRIGDVLYAAYPGHLWAVKVHLDQKTAGAQISLPVLMGAATCYAMPLTALLSSPNDLERVVREAGGHILERFRIPRSGIDVAAFLHAREHLSIKSSRDRMPE